MKTIAQRILVTLGLVLMINSLLLADGNDPKKESANVKTVSGQVIDQTTGETLAGVKVFIDGTDKVVYTDFDGAFQIQCDMSKNEQISVSMISYDVKTFKADDINLRKINLKRQN